MYIYSRRRNVAKPLLLAAGTLLSVGRSAQSQAVSASGHVPAVHPLGGALAVTAPGTLSTIAALRALRTGEVFVNDVVQRRVLMLDSNLAIRKVVADTSSATRRLYGTAATGLFAFKGDSTLFLDGSALSIVVLDVTGTIRRVMAPPRQSDFGQLIGGAAGSPGLDAKGRLIYRGEDIPISELIRRERSGQTGKLDTTALVRFDFSTRRLDTVTMLQTYTPSIHIVSSAANGANTAWYVPILNPAPVVDDWAVAPDGTIAVARGRDYHVEFIDAASRVEKGPKAPFNWRKLSDADKRLLVDSSRALRERLLTQGVYSAGNFAPLPGSEPVSRTTISVSNDAARAAFQGGRAPEALYVASNDLPDYQPAFAAGSLRADDEGRLWIRTIPPQPVAGGAIYDVFDRSGRLIDRVQVPRSSAIAGFGHDGTVYLAVRDGNGLRLQRHKY